MARSPITHRQGERCRNCNGLIPPNTPNEWGGTLEAKTHGFCMEECWTEYLEDLTADYAMSDEEEDDG